MGMNSKINIENVFAGTRLRVKSINWYNRYKCDDGSVQVQYVFVEDMSKHCGKIVTCARKVGDRIELKEDNGRYSWSSAMFDQVYIEPI